MPVLVAAEQRGAELAEVAENASGLDGVDVAPVMIPVGEVPLMPRLSAAGEALRAETVSDLYRAVGEDDAVAGGGEIGGDAAAASAVLMALITS